MNFENPYFCKMKNLFHSIHAYMLAHTRCSLGTHSMSSLTNNHHWCHYIHHFVDVRTGINALHTEKRKISHRHCCQSVGLCLSSVLSFFSSFKFWCIRICNSLNVFYKNAISVERLQPDWMLQFNIPSLSDLCRLSPVIRHFKCTWTTT